ncbi:MOSC domain-containing protein [Phaeosphaeria sp. MPI-PUGE-AT-0046c]|nr:MOSC domain-containing protein [Phaeosphaeria sp. MPI-PUGE-AT-0046c]
MGTGTASIRNVTKETVSAIEDAPKPKPATLLQVRAGKTKVGALGGEIKSDIYKTEHNGPISCSSTGLEGDEHVGHGHGGTERAVHQYAAEHYVDWQAEEPPHPELYETGAFGETVVTTPSLTEENVCIGDIFRLGTDLVLEVSEPPHPCYKLNARFEWPRALSRTIRTGRSGWNMRVLQTSKICKGDVMTLEKRPYPKWSIINVQRVIRGKEVPLELLAECTQLPMTDMWLDMAKERLKNAPKKYTLVAMEDNTSRVKKLTFALKEPAKILGSVKTDFEPYAFAQIKFGSDNNNGGVPFDRSYSIVDGDLNKFSLGVAFDRHSRGGSAYLHKSIRIGDEIEMYPGSNPSAVEHDEQCDAQTPRILVVGGIGITAFLPPDEAAFLSRLPKDKLTLYAKSQQKRLDIASVIPKPNHDGTFPARIFSCGPGGMMKECERLTTELEYPEHMVHFEDFGGGAGGDLGEPFEVEVDEPETKRHEKITVPSNKSMLDVLTAAGFDIVYSCKSGACGACKVTVCEGEIDYKSTALTSKQKGKALQTCVDRGTGKEVLKIEID